MPDMTRYDFIELSFREQDVAVFYRIAPAEPDVGFPNPYIGEYYLEDTKGRRLDWDLSQDEEWLVTDRIFDAERAAGDRLEAAREDYYDGLREDRWLESKYQN